MSYTFYYTLHANATLHLSIVQHIYINARLCCDAATSQAATAQAPLFISSRT